MPNTTLSALSYLLLIKLYEVRIIITFILQVGETWGSRKSNNLVKDAKLVRGRSQGETPGNPNSSPQHCAIFLLFQVTSSALRDVKNACTAW